MSVLTIESLGTLKLVNLETEIQRSPRIKSWEHNVCNNYSPEGLCRCGCRRPFDVVPLPGEFGQPLAVMSPCKAHYKF
jgi:hypothetical protein